MNLQRQLLSGDPDKVAAVLRRAVADPAVLAHVKQLVDLRPFHSVKTVWHHVALMLHVHAGDAQTRAWLRRMWQRRIDVTRGDPFPQRGHQRFVPLVEKNATLVGARLDELSLDVRTLALEDCDIQRLALGTQSQRLSLRGGRLGQLHAPMTTQVHLEGVQVAWSTVHVPAATQLHLEGVVPDADLPPVLGSLVLVGPPAETIDLRSATLTHLTLRDAPRMAWPGTWDLPRLDTLILTNNPRLAAVPSLDELPSLRQADLRHNPRLQRIEGLTSSHDPPRMALYGTAVPPFQAPWVSFEKKVPLKKVGRQRRRRVVRSRDEPLDPRGHATLARLRRLLGPQDQASSEQVAHLLDALDQPALGRHMAHGLDLRQNRLSHPRYGQFGDGFLLSLLRACQGTGPAARLADTRVLELNKPPWTLAPLDASALQMFPKLTALHDAFHRVLPDTPAIELPELRVLVLNGQAHLGWLAQAPRLRVLQLGKAVQPGPVPAFPALRMLDIWGEDWDVGELGQHPDLAAVSLHAMPLRVEALAKAPRLQLVVCRKFLAPRLAPVFGDRLVPLAY